MNSFQLMYEQFVCQTPVTVMFRATMENVFSCDVLDDIFAQTAKRQRVGELLFSTVVDLLGVTVCGMRNSVHAAYRAVQDRVRVSINSIYNKLNGVEVEVSRELVRRTAEKLKEVTRQMRPAPSAAAALFPGFRVKVLDGNHLPATEHRLAELRTTRSGPLPGQALCVLEPDCRLITDVFPCEDGHAQERSLLPQVLETVRRKDLWIADRNFCTTMFLFGIAERGGCFLIRQHASTLNYELLKKRTVVGRTATGMVYEQRMRLHHPDGRTLTIRRVTVVLDRPTESGDREIHLLTNLPKKSCSAFAVAEGYRTRWTVEHAFQELEQALESELKTLCYPQAALLAFCLAVATYNLMSVVKTALSKAHGAAVERDKLSGYYLADEISASYRGMMIALPPATWRRRFAKLAPKRMAAKLLQLAAHARPDQFRKTTRGPKKPRPKRTSGARDHHVSTAKLLAKRNQRKLTAC
jgi:IS4 transposase